MTTDVVIALLTVVHVIEVENHDDVADGILRLLNCCYHRLPALLMLTWNDRLDE